MSIARLVGTHMSGDLCTSKPARHGVVCESLEYVHQLSLEFVLPLHGGVHLPFVLVHPNGHPGFALAESTAAHVSEYNAPSP